ncbi:MAG: NINE protein [Anderseniella sp.]|nr:NINE protein [Anderseniella sp.]
MTFGKRGGQGGSMSRPAFAAAVPAANVDNEPGFLGRLFGGNGSGDFDIDLSCMQPYGHGKSVIMLVSSWLFFGTMGGHRFCLGHWLIACAMFALGAIGMVLIMLYSSQMIQLIQSKGIASPSPTVWYLLLAVGFVQTIWWLVDGIYVICRMLSAKAGG